MLVLTRKPDEKIIINNNIEIVVVDIQNGRVRLGINAPNKIPVHREEVHLAIKQGKPKKKRTTTV